MNTLNWKYSKGPVEQELIDKYEGVIGVSFPDSYREVVGKYGGARPKPDCFDMDDRKEAAVKTFLSYTDKDATSIFSAYETNKSAFMTGQILPFAIDNFGNYLCFDYRETTKNPPIIFYDHEAEADEGEKVFHFVSNSFDEFLDSLYEPED